MFSIILKEVNYYVSICSALCLLENDISLSIIYLLFIDSLFREWFSALGYGVSDPNFTPYLYLRRETP